MKAIVAEEISKQYRLGERGDSYASLRDTIASGTAAAAQRLLRRVTPYGNGVGPVSRGRELFYALRDVSFEIEEGAAVGLIGGNGSGKSTLLRILSRITTPTSGRARIRGRLASLLEVGTGFHGELTGRENVLMNGAILGMKHAEIKARFDEIVAFANVEQFIDTPVKRYSSGMFIRLAFAVAAHLDSDILLVDEVLAVGDAAFQKKCLARLDDARRDGRTVVFVSHDMSAVEQLCRFGLLLDRGRLVHSSDDIRACINEYADRVGKSASQLRWVTDDPNATGNGFRADSFYLADRYGRPVPDPLSPTDDAWIHVEGEVEPGAVVKVGYHILSANGALLYTTWQSDDQSHGLSTLPAGRLHLRSQIPPRLLNAGNYQIELHALVHEWPLFHSRATAPTISMVVGADLYSTQFWMLKRRGVVAPYVLWENAAGSPSQQAAASPFDP